MTFQKLDYQSRIRSHLSAMPPYTPIEPFEVLSERLGRPADTIIKLDANENPYGPAPAARRALAELQFPHIYPDPESRRLRLALAEFTGVPMQHLFASSGSDELIDLLMRLLLDPGDYVLTCPPTFGMYAFDTHVNAGEIVEVRRKPDFSLDLPAIKEAVSRYHPKILFLATPNNPDGSVQNPGTIAELLDLPILLVLDEAYIEFTGEGVFGEMATRISEVPGRENLVVLRTFSKWAGLAGLRVGYGAFPEWLMPVLWKAKQPYNVNVAASSAALATLQELDYLNDILIRLLAERQRLLAGLVAIPYLQPYPTHANFVLCRVTGKDAAELKSYLSAQHGILVRYFNTPGLQDHIRISVGRPEDTDALLQALQCF